jgi:hypothetical protein
VQDVSIAGWDGGLEKSANLLVLQQERRPHYYKPPVPRPVRQEFLDRVGRYAMLFRGYIDESYNKKLLGIQMVLRS